MNSEKNYKYLAFLFMVLALMLITFIVFLILKLTYTVSWDWIWILSPLWIGEFINVLSIIVIWLYYIIIDNKRNKE